MCQSFPLHEEARNKRENTYIYFLFRTKVMCIYRSLSPILICNTKYSIPKNNLRDGTLHNYANGFFKKKEKAEMTIC